MYISHNLYVPQKKNENKPRGYLEGLTGLFAIGVTPGRAIFIETIEVKRGRNLDPNHGGSFNANNSYNSNRIHFLASLFSSFLEIAMTVFPSITRPILYRQISVLTFWTTGILKNK